MDVRERAVRIQKRRRRNPVGIAVAGSLALHSILVALLLFSEGWMGDPPVRPKMRVYAVNIVSPPPNVAGEPPAEPPAPSSGPAASAPSPAPPAPPAPAPAPPPAPEPPAPEPKVTPPPPKATPPREQPKAPAPTPRPEPRPAERPKATEPRPKATEPRPKAAEPTRTTPRTPATTTNRPASTTNRPAADRPGTATRNERGGTPEGSGGARSTGTGTRGQATGRNPDPNSAGGEGLSLQQAGMECPSPGYCENVIRQVRRYFRRPEGASGSAEVCFTIQRDGGADDIEVNRVRGGFPFRLAVQEAVEQAGMRKAFGALPRAFNAATLPVCVDISPQL